MSGGFIAGVEKIPPNLPVLVIVNEFPFIFAGLMVLLCAFSSISCSSLAMSSTGLA